MFFSQIKQEEYSPQGTQSAIIGEILITMGIEWAGRSVLTNEKCP